MDAIELVKYSGSREAFATLTAFPERQFTINEFSREAGIPFASAWRLVKRWEQAGIILTGRVGRSVTVRLGRSPYVKSLSKLLEISVSPQAFTASALSASLAKMEEVRAAHLFGSVSRGDEKLASDIDLAILADKEFDANALVYATYRKYGTKLVPMVFAKKSELHKFMAGKKGVRLK